MRKRRLSGRPSGHRSKYRAIAADIAGKIAAGEFPVGKPLPTWSELSRTYDVGALTVGEALKVLKSEGYIHSQPRHRPVASLGFSLSQVLTNTIGIVLQPYLDCVIKDNEHWTGAMYRGVARAIIDPHLSVFMLQGTSWRTDFPAGLSQLPLQGLLLLGCPFKVELFKQYQMLNSRFPVVSLDEYSEYVHSVTLENYAMVRDATLRLIAMGHRRIAFVRPYHDSPKLRSIDSDSRQRADAFEVTCREAGLAPDDFKLFLKTSSADKGHSFQDLLRASPRFTAVLALVHAQQFADEAQAAGLRIPQDLSIVTINNSVPSRWTGPLINFEEFGRKGVELVLSKPRTLQHVRLPASGWNEGETAGPAPA